MRVMVLLKPDREGAMPKDTQNFLVPRAPDSFEAKNPEYKYTQKLSPQ
jgi:hypothetical protein